jgi:hypothetical protein
MTPVAIPLRDLGQRISQQQAELEKMRQEYNARQTRLRELTHRKEQLQAQLRQVEDDLQGIEVGQKPAKKPTTAAKPAATAAKGVSLAQLLVDIVSEAAGPLTVQQLRQEVEKRKYTTNSVNLSGLIATRVSALIKQKLLRRSKNQPGVLLVQGPSLPQGPAKKASNGVPTAGPKQTAVKKPVTPTAGVGVKSDVTLPDVVTQVLAGSARPLLARELADKVLESGYQTKSNNFTKVVGTGIGKMANVEHVKGKGYRLKKAKGLK